MSIHLQRAMVLMEQSRHDLAERELKAAAAELPEDAVVHGMLAVCLAERDDFDQATEHADLAVHLAPDLAYSHYARAIVLGGRNRPQEAEAAIAEALRLEPYDATFFAVLAQARLAQRRWADALSAAEQGLECEPEHVPCSNLRAMCLRKLGRKAEAAATMDSTLAKAPQDAFSHANRGWGLLEQGQTRQSLEHFSEALRLEPNNEFARAGMIEALKARYFVYRWMLRYFLWMARLSSGAQWAVILGLYFGMRGLNAAAKKIPALEPWVMPIIVLYVVFALMTWLAVPLFNLLLRLNRFGRHALSRDQRIGSNWVGGTLLAALLSLAGALATGQPALWFLALVFGLGTVPLSAVFACDAGWPRWAMAIYTAALLLVGMAAAAVFATGGTPGVLVPIFVIGVLLTGLVGNVLAQVSVKR